MPTTISSLNTTELLLNQASQNPVSITTTGEISTFNNYAIYGDAAAAWSITNDGTLYSASTAASAAGIRLTDGGTVVNGSATDTKAEAAGARIAVYIQGQAGTVTNFGAVLSAYGAAIYLQAGGTVTNAGTISGAAGTAIDFGGSAGTSNRLIVDPGAVFSGVVTAASAASNTLELASTLKAGTLSSIGSSFTNFNTVQVDAKAHWTLAGSNTFSNGSGLTLASSSAVILSGTAKATGSISIIGQGTGKTQAAFTIASTGSLQMAGTITDNVTDAGSLRATGGTLVINGNLGGAGSVGIDTNSVLDVTGSLVAAHVNFLPGGNSALDIGKPASIRSVFKGFLNTDTIDLVGVVGTSASFVAGSGGSVGTLTVTGSGGSVATLHFTGSYASNAFTATSDSHGGTLIKLG